MYHLQANAQWDQLASSRDDQMSLVDACLLIAHDEYPSLPLDTYHNHLNVYAQMLSARTQPQADLSARLTALNRFMYEELGFAGNSDDYDDPRNSYINDVLDRRLGIPISLAVIQMELAKHLNVPLYGVSFPGHFLLRMSFDSGLLVLDPFNRGRPVGADELKERAAAHFGGKKPDDQALMEILEPASPRAIVIRILRNLSGLYDKREDWARKARICDRILRLQPDDLTVLKERAMAYLRLGYIDGGRRDYTEYLARMEPNKVNEGVREQLIELNAIRTQLH